MVKVRGSKSQLSEGQNLLEKSLLITTNSTIIKWIQFAGTSLPSPRFHFCKSYNSSYKFHGS